MEANFTRRDFTRVALGAATSSVVTGHAGHQMIDSRFAGVTIGAQSYSFRDRPLDDAVAAMQSIGIGSCELWSGHTEPLRELRRDRAKLRAFRLETPLSHYEAVGKKFHDAGIDLHAFNYSFRDDFTDDEIARGFEMAKAMGTRVITASATISVAGRVNAQAERYGLRVGMHNHSRISENEYATPDDFAAASRGNSHIAVNLDIGHFVAAGFDPVEYVGQHHEQIVTLHIKDRKQNQGANMPFGEGDTPIRDVLALLRDKHYDIPANIEYEYAGTDTVVEVEKCFKFCQQILVSQAEPQVLARGRQHRVAVATAH